MILSGDDGRQGTNTHVSNQPDYSIVNKQLWRKIDTTFCPEPFSFTITLSGNSGLSYNLLKQEKKKKLCRKRGFCYFFFATVSISVTRYFHNIPSFQIHRSSLEKSDLFY